MFRHFIPIKINKKHSLPTNYTQEGIILYRELFNEARNMACNDHRKHMIYLLRMQLDKHRQAGINSHDSYAYLEYGYKTLAFLRNLNLHKPRN